MRLHHRPRRFAEVHGQVHVTRTLQNMLRMQRLPWVLFFSGPPGVGKTSLAHVIVRAVNCDQPRITAAAYEPCLECETCQAIHEYFVVWDCATNRGVADVNDIIKRAQIMVPEGKRRVILADECHMLTPEAQDRLLAELEREEMDRDLGLFSYPSMYVFGTTDPQRMKQAVLSRTCHLPLRALPAKISTQCLRDVAAANEITIPDDGLELIISLAHGDMRSALGYLEQAAIADLPWYESLQVVDPRRIKRLVILLWQQDTRAFLALLSELLAERRLETVVSQLLPMLFRVVIEPAQLPRASEWLSIIDTLNDALRLSRANPDGAAAALYTRLAEILSGLPTVRAA